MSRHVIISPSIMCAKPWDIPGYVAAFEKKGIDLIHFDVMDGHFVPNIMLGASEFAALKEITRIPLDVHLMCEEADRCLDYFKVTEGDWVSFHPEACRPPYRTISKIRGLGCKAGVALSPGTPIAYIEELLGQLDFVLVMAVEPGFAGQTMVPDHLQKLSRIRRLIDESGRSIEIIIDGNTTVENSKKMLAAGATGLVTGTSSMLKHGVAGFEEAYDQFMQAIQSA